MCDRGISAIVDTPAWSGHHGPTICLDACIATTILDAWDAGVRTLGSCCGHGDRPPSLVLTEDVDQPALARRVLADLDPRPFTLHQWHLVTVSETS